MGIGGYQDAMLGIHFVFSGDGWGVCSSKEAWDPNMIECSKHAKWTEEDRSRQFDEIMRYISDLLKAAKVKTVDQLKNVPVEVEFENQIIKSWRILTEVI